MAISKNFEIIDSHDLITDFKEKELVNLKVKLLEMEDFKKQAENTKSRVEKDYKKYRDLNLEKVKQADEIVKVG